MQEIQGGIQDCISNKPPSDNNAACLQGRQQVMCTYLIWGGLRTLIILEDVAKLSDAMTRIHMHRSLIHKELEICHRDGYLLSDDHKPLQV